MNIGERVRSRRMQLQLSIAEISKRSGLSSPFLSQLEHGHTQASLDSLLKIAKALEVSLGYFDSNSNGHNVVRTPQHFLHFLLGSSGTSYARMGSGDSDNQLEPLLVTVPPNSTQETLNHMGEAFFTVLQGRLWVGVEGQEHELEAGCGVHVKLGMPYSWRNPNPKEVKLIWVGTPKLF